jgi:hypothetical protein
MPAKLNVGASRKVADGRYGSRGASVNLEIELDHSVVFEPARLHERIRQIFKLVHQALAEELKRDQSLPSSDADSTAKARPNSQPRFATAAQVKAIYAIAKQLGADLADALHQQFGVQRPEELTVKQASALIDSLKATRTASAA